MAVAKESGDDNEVFFRIQGLVLTNEPFVVRYHWNMVSEAHSRVPEMSTSGIPGWIDNCRTTWVTEGLVRDMGVGQDRMRLQLPVT